MDTIRETIQLRPHHLFCSHFLGFFDPSRGEHYTQARAKLVRLFTNDLQELQVKEGSDFLCITCPYFNGAGCAHSNGDEIQVMKWDTGVIDGMGLHFGQTVTVAEVKSFIKEKMPLDFCTNRCPYRKENRCNPEIYPHHFK